MDIFLIGFSGALVGGLCLSATYVIYFYFEKKRVQKETDAIVNEFKNMTYHRTLNNRNLKNDGSKFN